MKNQSRFRENDEKKKIDMDDQRQKRNQQLEVIEEVYNFFFHQLENKKIKSVTKSYVGKKKRKICLIIIDLFGSQIITR